MLTPAVTLENDPGNFANTPPYIVFLMVGMLNSLG
jgi:hypothetical protein